MTKKSRIIAMGFMILAVSMILLITGCVSVPQKKGPDDSLVVIMCEIANPDKLSLGRKYKLHFSCDTSPVLATPHFVTVLVREPGVELISVRSWLTSEYTGKSTVDDFKILMPFNPGKLIIADFVFLRKAKKIDDRSVSFSYEFRKITKEERDLLMTKLRQNRSFAQWLE